MIYQETKTEILSWGFIVFLLFILIAIFILGIFFLYLHISLKIHISYHKGYNKAKDDKVQYYKSIKEIIDSYNKIFSELTNTNNNYTYKASTLELMLNFKSSLQKYYDN